MTRRTMLAVIAGTTLAAQDRRGMHSGADFAKAARVNLKGTVEKLQLDSAAGMPSMWIASGTGAPVRVVLGSMRYLLEQDFRPKAGTQVEVTGFQLEEGVFAATVTLVGEKKVLKLRESDGTPMWRGGRFGGERPRN